jgi:hypothetical protein
MTREEIDAEADRLLGSIPIAKAHARPLLIAYMEHHAGLPIDQKCPYCGGSLSVVDHGTAWTVTCDCKKSESSFRGL